MAEQLKVVIACGGTGGHLFPGVAVAEELKRRGLHYPFETISRADRMLDDKVLATLAEMGCFRIWIGSESGSQRILDATDEFSDWHFHA